MTRYYIILLLILHSVEFYSQTDCIDFTNYDQSQEWIRELNKLDNESRKDSILKWIQCERVLGLDNVKFRLACIFEGYYAYEIPESRDYLLKQIDADHMQLINSICEMENIYPERCDLGMLLISGLDKPVINNIPGLLIKRTQRKNDIIRISVYAKSRTEIALSLYNFCKTEPPIITHRQVLKKRRNRIELSVDNELKLIEIQNNDQKILIIR